MFDRWTGFSALADEACFVLAMPSAVGEIWNDGRFRGSSSEGVDDVGYLLAVAEDACERLPIDRGRIYAVGMSNGATMAGRLACEQAGRIAAVAQVAGTVAVDVIERCRPAMAVPILSIHGTRDRYAPYAGGSARGMLARLIVRRAAGPCLGVEEWARFWTGVNQADDGPVIQTLPPDTTVRRWRGATPASDIVFYRVERGGHTWPGNRMWMPPFMGRTSQTFDATRVIWEFLAAHHRET
jgi:polyhydroxybutyrate depolymerase